MNIEKMKTVVEALNNRAIKTEDATEAMKFTQAALNAANASCSLADAIARTATS